MKPLKVAAGFSLIELMVGLALGSFIMLGVISATTGLMRGEAISSAKLDSELRNAAFVLQRDISRAGYRGDSVAGLLVGVPNYTSPFNVLGTAVEGCVTYAYDLNSNGVLDTTGRDERFAIAVHDRVLYLRTGGEDFDCDPESGSWEPLTDPALVHVTEFTVSVRDVSTPIPGQTKSIHTRDLTYVLTGKLVKGSALQKQTLTATIRLQNDILY